MVVFAKSNPIKEPQTLWTHTNHVIQNAKKLEKEYPRLEFLGDTEQYFWDALKLACMAHDMGKISTPFQYKICKSINKQREKHNMELLSEDMDLLKAKTQKIIEIPHNILSPAFVLKEIKRFPENIQACICQAIAYHHNRGKTFVNNTSWHYVIQAINADLRPVAEQIDGIKNYFSDELIVGDKYKHQLLYRISNNDMFYIMLKGFLHRADYCASADVPILKHAPNYTKEKIKKHIQQFPNPWQLDTLRNNLDENIIMLAGTGMGKTEFALYWSAGKKTFYTLPIRTSVNAIYERVKNSFKLNADEVGLLHSNASEYLKSQEDNSENDSMSQILSITDITRQLSMHVSVSTADQIFSSVFHYPGYERIHSTMAYSRIIIDELQAYDPGIIAAILHGLVDFSRLGAKFCIITATLPEFCIKYLDEKIGNITKPDKQYKTHARHQIKLIDDKIDSTQAVEIIKYHAKDPNKKILIIINTVKTAIQMKKLLDKEDINVNLLHSRFTFEDRIKKESDKETGILYATRGVWITTQIVEASVDIDFDVLITEISTMDSQIQRWGRIWRNRCDKSYTIDMPNIYILSQPSDDGYIYDKDIVKKTYDILSSREGKKLSDKEAYDMFNEIFSGDALESTNYLESFEKSIRMLEELNFVAENKRDAQKLFRDVPNISVIPKSVYENNKTEINQSIMNLHGGTREERKMALMKIKNKIVSISYRGNNLQLETIDQQYRIMISDLKYSFDYGVELS